MDLEFFHRVLNVDSTSGKEARLADMLAAELSAPGRKVEVFEVGDGTRKVLVSCGRPKVVFCTHLDTVPPYIPPVIMEPLHRNDSMVSEGEKNSESVNASSVLSHSVKLPEHTTPQ